MSKPNVRRYNAIEKHMNREKGPRNNYRSNLFYLSKHLKKIYPTELIHKTCSLPASDYSSLITPLDQKRREVQPSKIVVPQISPCPSEKELMRCSWITNSTVSQVYSHCSLLFELLSLAGLLMDFNWTEILKRREQIREGFVGFNAKQVAKMGKKEINELVSNASLMLAENRVRSIVDNAKCIVKIGREFGSFSCYMWNHMNYKPIINKFRNARNVPLRSPKAEAISKDLVKRGLRHVGPVIVNSFMQAAGMTNDHLIYCFRHKECLNLAERPWKHV
ncbi:hypothetical protein HAX54_044298 [Datura stramonium]|uniref:DNA-3-methyladenine glycosylase I n=1 Tax=Datura stramonium TaxID=4076 RepID=A0ABS8W2H5_DATST|nr:hypothetical protein [Datura stramonium]